MLYKNGLFKKKIFVIGLIKVNILNTEVFNDYDKTETQVTRVMSRLLTKDQTDGRTQYADVNTM